MANMEQLENKNPPHNLRPRTAIPRPPLSAIPTSRSTSLSALTDSSASHVNIQTPEPSSTMAPSKIAMKRELPQPVTQPSNKRKALAEKVGEFPAASTRSLAPATASRANITGTSLIGASGLKPPNSRMKAPTTKTSALRNIYGITERPGPYERPKTSGGRLGPRTRSQGRPPTSMSASDEPPVATLPKKDAFDVDNRLVSIEQQFSQLKNVLNESATDRSAIETTIAMLKARIAEQETEKVKHEQRITNLQSDLDKYKDESSQFKRQLEEAIWKHKTEIETLVRENKHAREDLERVVEMETLKLNSAHNEAIEILKRRHAAELEEEKQARIKEVADLQLKLTNEHQDVATSLAKKDNEMNDLKTQIEILKSEVTMGQSVKTSLQTNIAEISASNAALEAKINSLKSHIEFLESDSKAQSDSFATMETKLQEAQQVAELAQKKLIKEETERRILFNKYQELKGNIRVMCRVRPAINEGETALIEFPDADQSSAKISVMGPEERSSLGILSRKDYPFEFDRVFSPAVNNEEIFGEISQLVQSALDGYNVCIFCYGQTGSGKTYTMSSSDGMIPRATHMIYETVTKLKEKSWTYSMEGSFIEVYNEELNDLLTPADPKAKKLEIRHDDIRKQTTVLNCKTVELTSADKVETMLAEAQNNRSVAATKANERSSRSHSVFILKLFGRNSATSEQCEGTLNLVDLAGSERLKHSQAEGERMKETQNINKSLACLGDVIDALGRGSQHIPYRNSKLTHLLQYSLGGNSKTLMFVMMSPLEAHLKETLTSLRFAAKVYNTHIGTAKATKKMTKET